MKMKTDVIDVSRCLVANQGLY